MRKTSTRFLHLVLLLCCPLVAVGQITFTFTYLDAGTGFNDPVQGATRRAALQSAAGTLASYFTGYPARTVPLTVNASTNNGGDATLASAGSSSFVVANSFEKNLVQQMIQTGNNNGQASLGSITWNFGHSWDYTNSVAPGSFDFKAVATHELLHAVGFSSAISAAGTGLGGGTTWSFYDKFLTDVSGNPLVTVGGVFNGGTILTNGVGSDVYFSGPNAMAANGGQRVHIYSPASFVSGSSLSHLDTDFFTSVELLMEHAVTSGPATRTLGAIELGILTDIGYSVAAIPEPSTVAAIAGLCSLGFAVWRRRVRAAARPMEDSTVSE